MMLCMQTIKNKEATMGSYVSNAALQQTLSAIVIRPDGTRINVGIIASTDKREVSYNKAFLKALTREKQLEDAISILQVRLKKMQDSNTQKFKQGGN